MKIDYKTTTFTRGEYKIIATQRVKDESAEGGFAYVIFKGEHIVDQGSTRFAPYSDSVPSKDLEKQIINYIESGY